MDDHTKDLLDALERFVVAEIAATRRESGQASVASERAVLIATKEANERLAAHNGLIEQMRQQASHFAPRELVDLARAVTDERLSRLERWQSQLAGALILVTFLVPFVSFAIARLFR